jgi:hypothetical protein
MSLRRKLLERQYINSLKKEKVEPTSTKPKGWGKDAIYSNPSSAKPCAYCGSKVSSVFSPNAGKDWYCYGHRPETTEEEKQEQTRKTKIMEEYTERKLRRKRDEQKEDGVFW